MSLNHTKSFHDKCDNWDFDPRNAATLRRVEEMMLPPGPSYRDFDMTKSVMEGWVQTYTRSQVWPLKLTVDQVDLNDIAHALSMKVRFTGHCNRFYSIAEHSVRVCLEVQFNQNVLGDYDPNLLMCSALMHDAAEYILPDVAAPIKHMLPGFKELEHKVEQVIASRFELKWPWPKEVKDADNALVLLERRDNMKPNVHPWDVPGLPSGQHLQYWEPAEAERAFLLMAQLLGIR